MMSERERVELLENALAYLSAIGRPQTQLAQLLVDAYERGGVLSGEQLGYALDDAALIQERLTEFEEYLKALRAKGTRVEGDYQEPRARRVK